ncbi:FG-GAP-like repeat-containing protein [Polaribacter cellanae]|uniref:VCBS repeat-containing protein n=1 Tax=Polaribacter cellanae TaxID=2818493 RepID=A0A975H713_9FLAO|nr:FG-GAP-like repeat-containing protein [Polaribacter cellanae]QTE22997.1 VCBS repeat-containing protein [Polaribacter cellanae]
MKNLILFIALSFSLGLTAQKTIYVNVNTSGGNKDGTSWANAYTNLQNAITNAKSGDEIWVAKGTYKPTSGTDQTISFVIPEGVKLLGGFNGTEKFANKSDWRHNKTFLSGDLNGNNTADAGDSHTIVRMIKNKATLSGFIISYSFADGAESTPAFVGRTGGGVYNAGNNHITNCIFQHNTAQGNATNGVGGAIVNFSGNLSVTNALFYQNTASANGGAISVEGGTITLTNATIADNTANKGGGVHFFYGNLIAINSIFTQNTGTNGNINNDGGPGTATVSHSLFYNTTTGNNGKIPPKIKDNGNNLENTNPIYNSIKNINGYQLTKSSPAVGKGVYEYKTPLFTQVTGTGTGLPNVNAGSVAFGDIDNDGDLDVLITGYTGSVEISKTYTNDGNGNYTEKQSLIGVSDSSVAFGDIDNDGDLDILLTGYADVTTISKIYTNDGSGNFTETQNLIGIGNSSVAFGDIDNDGDLDILLTGRVSGGSIISKTYTNDGSGKFTGKQSLTAVDQGSVAFGDIDNDGDLDILLTGETGLAKISKIYTNNGNGIFTEKQSLSGIISSSLAFGDIDNDGDLDILLSGSLSSGRTSKTYTNDGNGNFTEKQSLIGCFYSSVAFGDMDNDGDLDILLTGRSSSGKISKTYSNDGNGNFTEKQSLIGVDQGSVAFGDIDNDGDLDILITGFTHTPTSKITTKIYKNNSSTPNTKPTAPTNLTAVINKNDTATLSWTASTDNETKSTGLSYNVYIKENPVGTSKFLKSPMANENNGWRKLPALGNAQQNTSYNFKLPASSCGKTFNFKVQAIDPNFAGSAFSSEKSFTVSPKIIYVNASATGKNDGTSWANAYTHLQDALANKKMCINEIWVAKGTYTPGNKRTDAFNPTANVKIYGGFNGIETTLNQRNWKANPTILSGEIGAAGNTDNSYTLLRIKDKNNITIDGLIFENANANADVGIFDDQLGAGIYNYNSNNTTINNCIFRNNNALLGTAIYHRSGTGTSYTNCLFFNNTAEKSNPVFVDYGKVSFINCSMVNNTPTTKGKGIIGSYKGTITLTNSIIAGNHVITNNPNTELIDSGSFTVNYSYLKGENPTGTNNINGTTLTDPLFVNVANNDFSLKATSPLVDVGNNTANTQTKDLAGNSRVFKTNIDLGAYEYKAPLFTEVTSTGLPNVYSGSVAFGDVDNDGDLDVLITGKTGGGTRISKTYTNDGNGNYTEKQSLAGIAGSSVAFGDIDNDGDLDILLTGYTGSKRISKTYTNDGNGNYTEKQSLTGITESSVAFGDIDNDGDVDILLSGFSGSGAISKTYTNDGNGNFTEKQSLIGVYYSSVALGDMDNDGDVDILLSGYTGSGAISKTYTNDGDGNFTEKQSLAGIARSSVAFGDIDNDGDLDFVLTEYRGTRITKTYTNDGNGNFTEKQNLTGVYRASVAFGDMDNDGDLDILLSGQSSSGKVSKTYTNDGNGNFTETQSLTGVGDSSVAFGDIDNDGDLDIVITGFSHTPTTKIYKNNSSTPNTKPTAPTNLTAVINKNDTATLSWTASTDNETKSTGLSYNVYIKETPVGTPKFVKSPMANENNGWRKLPALGNAQQNTRYTFKLPNAYCGTTPHFTFKVQAIDPNFTGSAFSSEKSFSVSTTPKTIYVNASATGKNDGTSWVNAYNSLQDGVKNAGFCGDEIWIAKGIYKPGNNRTDAFTPPANVKIYGGFNGTETTLNQRNWKANPTILSGEIGAAGNADNSYTLLKIEDKNKITIDGLIFENAFADNKNSLSGRTGAGIYINKASNITIDHGIFRNLTAKPTGANGVGAGIVVYESTASVKVNNSLFYNNTATYGGAISVERGAQLDLVNCTLVNNTATNTGGGLHSGNSANVVNITNSIFSGNKGTVKNANGVGITINNSYLQGENPTGTNNINGTTLTDPLFVNVANNDFSLKANSPLVDVGNNTSNKSTKDLAGNSRVFNTTIDLGAYEYDALLSNWTGATNSNWNDATNWSNGIPTLNSTGVIKNVSKLPIINVNAKAKDIVVENGATLSINAGKSLSVERNLSNSGKIVINSNATKSGSLLVKENATGILNYNRYVTNDWHLIGVPVMNQNIYDFVVTDAAINKIIKNDSDTKYAVGVYDNTKDSNRWTYILTRNIGSAGDFKNGTGYALKRLEPLPALGGTYQFVGNIENNNKTIKLKDGSATSGNSWNALGNPYPSFINANNNANAVNNLLTYNATSLQPTNTAIYVWEASTASYKPFNNTSKEAKYIAPGQGFFVAAKTDGVDFTITKEMLSHQNGSNLFYKTYNTHSKKNKNTRFEVLLKMTSDTQNKSTEIIYLKNATKGLDIGYDAGLFTGENIDFSIYSHLLENGNGTPFSLQCLPNKGYNSMVVPIGVNAKANKTVVFSLETKNIPEGLNIYLEDVQKNTFTKLNDHNNYTITFSKAQKGVGRFFMHTTKNVLSVDRNNKTLKASKIWLKDKKSLEISTISSEAATIKLFDVLGKQVFSTSVKGATNYTINLPEQLKTAVYIVKLKTAKGIKTKKVIVRK